MSPAFSEEFPHLAAMLKGLGRYLLASLASLVTAVAIQLIGFGQFTAAFYAGAVMVLVWRPL